MALSEDQTTKASLQSATTHLNDDETPSNAATATEKNQRAAAESGPLSKELQLSMSTLSLGAPVHSAAFAPTIESVAHGVSTNAPSASRQLLRKIFATPQAEVMNVNSALKKLEDLMAQAAEQAQRVKDEKVRQKQEKLKAASEQIIQDVVDATASFVPEKKDEPQAESSEEQGTPESDNQVEEDQAEAPTSEQPEAQPKDATKDEHDAERNAAEPEDANDADESPRPIENILSPSLAIETDEPETAYAEIVAVPTTFHGDEEATKEWQQRSDEHSGEREVPVEHPSESTAVPDVKYTTPKKKRKSVSFPADMVASAPMPARPFDSPSDNPHSSSPSHTRSPQISGATLGKLHAHAKGISSYINRLPIRSGNSLPGSPAVQQRKSISQPLAGIHSDAMTSSLPSLPTSPYTPPVRKLEVSQSAALLTNPAPRPTSSLNSIPRERSTLSNSSTPTPLLERGSQHAPSMGSPLRPSHSASILPTVLSPIASQLPSLLSTTTIPSFSPHDSILANRSLKSFHRSDAERRKKIAQKEDSLAAQTQAKIALEGFHAQREAAQRAAFQADIQVKLLAYESRLKHAQQHKEAIYANKIADISRRLQDSITSAHHDNPFSKASETSSALEVSRNQAKLKLLLQAKAEQAAQAALVKEKARLAQAGINTSATSALTLPSHPMTEKRQSLTNGTSGGAAASNSSYVPLTAAELSSLGIPLPPPPLPVEDLSLVSQEIWSKHIRYLTDLEAEQRLIYAEYIIEKRKLEQKEEQNESVRVELLNRRYMKGLTGDVLTANESVQKEQQAKREKADEAWRLKQEFDSLNESMLAMGVAGDADAELSLQQRLNSLEDPSRLNQNLLENRSFASALLQQELSALAARPLEMDAESVLAAKIVAEEKKDELLEIKPRLQMELEVTNEPPITDVMHIKDAALRTESHSAGQCKTMQIISSCMCPLRSLVVCGRVFLSLQWLLTVMTSFSVRSSASTSLRCRPHPS